MKRRKCRHLRPKSKKLSLRTKFGIVWESRRGAHIHFMRFDGSRTGRARIRTTHTIVQQDGHRFTLTSPERTS